MKKLYLIILFLLSALSATYAQWNKHDLTFSGSGDLQMALGRYQIGTAIQIICQIGGGWAEVGGVYHIAGDWNENPKLVYRAESGGANERLKFYSYVDPAYSGFMFLFATWDNQSPSWDNVVKFSISSMGAIDPNATGTFSLATEMPLVLALNSYSGNVGIGTANPFSGVSNLGLHLAKGDHSSVILGDPVSAGHGGIVQTSDARHRVFIGANLYDDPSQSWRNFQLGKGGAGISILADKGSWGSSIEFYVSDQDGFPGDLAKMFIKGDGSVGIGTTNTGDANYRLFVEKGIRTRKVKVDMTSWADYVFEPSYRLPSLYEVEQFIKQFKHLPGVPSDREVEENGLDLGEGQAVLLKKIEELTLYVIELKKEIDQLKVK